MRSVTGALALSHNVDILLDTGSTDLDVVSADYCEAWGHPILPAPERLQGLYISALGCAVNIQGMAKICLRWRGQSGTKTLVREFAVVEDFPQDMSFGNRTITRYNLLRESAGLLLPLIFASRSKKVKDRDKEQAQKAKEIAKSEEAKKFEDRLKRWDAATSPPYGNTFSSKVTTCSETPSSAETTSPSEGRSQDSSQCTSLTSDPV